MNTNNFSGPTPMARPTPRRRTEIQSQSELSAQSTANNYDYSDDNDILDFGTVPSSSEESYNTVGDFESESNPFKSTTSYTDTADDVLNFSNVSSYDNTDTKVEDTSSYEYVPPTSTSGSTSKRVDGAWEKTIKYSSDHIYTENKAEKPNENVLYIILDKPIDGVMNYFRCFGVNVSRVFNDIKSAKAQILMQVEPTEILIIDSGTGEFTSTAARKEIIDLIGLCDEGNIAEIFYCDDLLKSEIQYNEVLQKSKVDVTWHRFKSLAMVLVYLLERKKNVNFVKDSSYGRTSDIYTNLNIRLQENTDEVTDPNESPDTITINTNELIMCIKDRNNGNTLLEGFNTVLRS